jgi:hypothetical protein
MLAYALTENGHRWILSRLDVDPTALLNPTETSRLADATQDRIEMRKKIIEFTGDVCKGADCAVVGRDFDKLFNLNPDEFWEPGRDAVERWMDEERLGAAKRGRFSADFAHVASILTQLPCTEAAAERSFSVMKWVLRKDRLRGSRKLLLAIMLIRMNMQYGALPV